MDLDLEHVVEVPKHSHGHVSVWRRALAQHRVLLSIAMLLLPNTALLKDRLNIGIARIWMNHLHLGIKDAFLKVLLRVLLDEASHCCAG